MVLLTQIDKPLHWLTASIALCLALAALPALAENIDERSWHDASSENFRIKTVLGEERTVELLRHLEIMRASLGHYQDNTIIASATPTVIVAVDQRDDYVGIGAPAYSAGFFFSDLRENAILIEDSDGSSGVQVILHEYAHYLNRQAGRIRYPRWYEEGSAEYLSHSRVTEHSFEYALAPQQHLATLGFNNWMPLPELLAVSDTSALTELNGALYYAQSWLLVHYLRSLPDADLNIPVQLRKFAELAATGTAPPAAFTEAFALDLERLEEDLLRYYLERQFTTRVIPVNTALPGFNPQFREMSHAEVMLALAQMAVRFENTVGAEQWFRQVLGDAELRAYAEAGLGRIAGFSGDIETADERFETAIYLMAWDFSIWMDYAQYWAQRVSTSHTHKERLRHAERLIEALKSALTIADATPELNSLMGFAYLAKGEKPLEAIEYLEAAAAAAPHDQASRLLLANAYLFVGKPDEAKRIAEAVLRFEHEPNLVTNAAHEVIDDARRQGAH